ncbi:MAG: CemA family protein [Oscillatoriophycideae cyanobacterium NC_groundwater_1537_Pr4_S-0.65um_50_18]|nr:CemA family protein [Oscillatoriophycideae cyanobacterium NC_groundwater_1537_Pr4_S-0.65um_50_18]
MKPWNFPRVNQWMSQVSLRRLENAYTAATAIKAIEDQYFNGKIIGFDRDKGKITCDYFQTQLSRELATVRINLAQFRIGSFVFNRQLTQTAESEDNQLADSKRSIAPEILDKLEFIESVVGKYRDREDELDFLSSSSDPLSHEPTLPGELAGTEAGMAAGTVVGTPPTSNKAKGRTSAETAIKRFRKDKNATSLFQGLSQIGKELSPEFEQEVVMELRNRRKQNRIAIRWLVLLIVIPLAVQFLTRNLLVAPVLERYGEQHYVEMAFSHATKEASLREFVEFKEGLEIQQLLGLLPKLNEEEVAKKLKEAALEGAREAMDESLNGWKNILSDTVSLTVFAVLAYFGRSRITLLRGATSRAFLNLSDPTKVFLFILVTDIFVGFHSAEGWDVILAGIAEHLGVPENKAAINLFIATVPVFMDSCIKFWIFNFLTRYSPATSAIYERMNT